MKLSPSIFFCAIGGSGMMPLALLCKARGATVSGSDRSYDQGRTPERFAFLTEQGIDLYPQNGSGVTTSVEQMVVSTAIEPTVPDYQAALENHIPIIHRAELLAALFNQADIRIAIAGTSGKSTTTGLTGWILHKLGRTPTLFNGAVMKNFATKAYPFASAIAGSPDLFVSEVDESDGSITHFAPTIAVLNNIALDHKSMEELRALFRPFVGQAQHAVVNIDNAEATRVMSVVPVARRFTTSLKNPEADLYASGLFFRPTGISFDVTFHAQTLRATLHVPGAHNVANALSALGATICAGAEFAEAVDALSSFDGIVRRMDVIGTHDSITVIDDFAHNPDKITATLDALHQFDGRLLVLFQPHGFGPLKLMRKDLVAAFAAQMKHDDMLFLPDPLYLGGTADRSVGSKDIANDLSAKGCRVTYRTDRADCAREIIDTAQNGDRIVVMGARDDTLPLLAQDILEQIRTKNQKGAL